MIRNAPVNPWHLVFWVMLLVCGCAATVHGAPPILQRYTRALALRQSQQCDLTEPLRLRSLADQAFRMGFKQQAHIYLTQAIQLLEEMRACPGTAPVGGPQTRGGWPDRKQSVQTNPCRTLELAVPSDRVRVIQTIPGKVAPPSDDVLAHFTVMEQAVEDGRVTFSVCAPLLVEAAPFSPMTFTQNKAIGATAAGQVLPALSELSPQEQDARESKILDYIAQAGVGIARDFQSYGTRRFIIEPRLGSYDFAHADMAVKAANAWGIDYIGRISPHYGDIRKEGPPADESAYLAYVRKLVGHFKGRIHYWQVLKEPSPQRRGRRMDNEANLSPQQAAHLLQITYRQIKEIDPDAVVIFPGMGPEFKNSNWTVKSYLEAMVAAGAAEGFDVLGYEAYVFDVEANARLLRDILARHGQSKPLWLVQTGVPDGPTPLGIHFRGGGSDKAQASFMLPEFAKAFSSSVEKVFWGEFVDKSQAEQRHGNPFSRTWDKTGLFRVGTWTRKPGYFTLRLLATALNGFTAAERLTHNIAKFSFADRSPIYAVWP